MYSYNGRLEAFIHGRPGRPNTGPDFFTVNLQIIARLNWIPAPSYGSKEVYLVLSIESSSWWASDKERCEPLSVRWNCVTAGIPSTVALPGPPSPAPCANILTYSSTDEEELARARAGKRPQPRPAIVPAPPPPRSPSLGSSAEEGM